MTSGVSKLASPRNQWLLVTAWLILGIYYLLPITEVLEPYLDSSIRATYAHFTAHGFQFGSQVNTTAGPYGFVMYGWDYDGELFWARFVLTVLFSYALAALVLWFFLTVRERLMRWIWLTSVVLGVGYGDNQFNVSILLCGVFLLLNFKRRDRRVLNFLTVAFLACLSLMKGTQLAVALGVIATILTLALVQRVWRSAAWLAGTYLFSLIGWWILAGQNPLHLPTYVAHLHHIAEGYNEAMALYETAAVFRIGVSLLLVLCTLILLVGWRQRRSSTIVAGCVLIAGITWVAWKHGYVRADGHALVFLDLGCILALTLLLLERTPAAIAPTSDFSRHAMWALGVAAITLGLYGGENFQGGRFRSLVFNVAPRLKQNSVYLFTPCTVKQLRDAELEDHAHRHASTYLRKTVGRSSIDYFGHEMGLLLLNALNYQPSPMCCGSYHVYNRYFKELNFQHFADPRTRPDFVLLNIQSIDERFVPNDDSLSLIALLDLYRPVVFEHNAVLLESRKTTTPPQKPRVILTRKLQFNEDVPLPDVAPDELVLFSVELPSSWTGSLRAFVYKPPLVFMDLHGDGLEDPINRRVVPESLAVTSLLSPALEKTDDYIGLFAHRADKKVRSFRLHTARPHCFDASAMSVTFSVVKRPPILTDDEIRRVYLASVYQDPPDAIDPPNATVDYYQNVRVQYLHTPASFMYRLRGDERRFSMTVGIDEQAWLSGHTDGVDFYIELLEPGQSPKLLNRRFLQPVTHPDDRGTHELMAPLPPTFARGSQLVVRADPGPNRDASWDWSFATDIKFARGAFVPEQFPGFKTLPVDCDASSVSPHNTGSRDVVMVAAPGGMTFALTGTEHELNFTGGMLESSYTSGNTDGVVFVIDYELPDGRTQHVFSRSLKPKTTASDRGDQMIAVKLPPAPPGTRLRFRTDPGPAGNNAFDWVYVSALELR